MAALPDGDRFDVWAEFMRDAQVGATGALTKAQLRAAVNAVDAWIDANAASLNAAIPQPARAALTAAQKALLLTHVVRKRYVKGA